MKPPALPIPWHRPFATGSDVRVRVTHVTDPACPWAYSFEPVLRALEARYGDQLEWRTVMIGLSSSVEEMERRGFTPARMAESNLGFRRYGMPIAPHLRSRLHTSAPACRLVKAAERQGVVAAEAVLRALRLAWFTTDALLDADEALAQIAESVTGLDASRALNDLHSPEVDAAYEADRAEARTAHPVAVKLNRTANSDGAARHTAPTLLLTADDDRVAVVPGFQPFEAAEVALVGLEPRIERLPVPELPDLLAAYPGGITSQEVARVVAETTDVVDRDRAERALIALAAAGRARRVALADDALWLPA